ncbi:MAG: alcohol dehydrogenase catalytic domain-containing protein [Bryobacterales bacterium]|nr:alcohol dehydrogenase catalytic domain-containing protein [Bryobacterales bacterium]
MEREAIAACLSVPRGPVEIKRMPVAAPGKGEALVRMEACGICHSDVMITGLEKLPLTPLVLGHEGIGVVEEVGDGVANVAAGDRVGITYFAAGCGACEACRAGFERYCAKQTNHGYTRQGVLATAGIVAARNLIRVPGSLTAEEAAPLCCAGWTAMGALGEAGVGAGQLVAIFGFGGLGHLALQYARHAGARTAVVDVGAEKLEFARQLGADVAVAAEDARKTLVKEHGGADAAIVFTASAAAVPVAFSCLKRRGSLILVGLTADTYTFSVTETVLKGIRIQGSYLGSRADLERVFELAERGVARPKVTVYGIEAAPELMGELERGGLTGRAVIRF